MARLFGTNGIRGVFGVDFDLEFIHDIAVSVAAFFGAGPILVGYDGRSSNIVVTKTVCSALNYAGTDCRLAGLVPTPCLEYATEKLGYAGAIMVTASHNPPQYNGIKPVASDGVEISRADELEIEEIYFNRRPPAAKKFGTAETDDRTIPAYIEGIKSQVDHSAIRKKRPVIVIDAGNGAQAVTAPVLCEQLGCKTVLINGMIDGGFPGRGPEPLPENLHGLSDAVRKHGADLGVAFDGDGDRSMFCDQNGAILSGDQSALLLSGFILEKNPRSTIVTCINSGSSIESLARRYDSDVIRTAVGSVEVSRRMVSAGALVGFEENGGFMYGRHNQVRDGAMALALALDLFASRQATISECIGELPESFTAKDKVPCSPEGAQRIMAALKSQNPDADTTDGIKIITDEKNWVMVRPSGTEPIVRIYAEGGSPAGLGALMSGYVAKIKSILSE